ncbi:MAG: VanZ family protein [Methylococcaceae bacterium]|jgi:VanZ family protein
MNKHIFWIALLYLCFVIYGSLVPLHYRSIPFEEAVRRFQHIPYLNLGIGSRADWVANILLYIPLTFLWTAVFAQLRYAWARLLLAAVVLCASLSVALVVEFTQLFFAPRTVSINDLIAETLGSFLGIAFWYGFGDFFTKQYRYIALGNILSIKAVIVFYIVSYLILSFFPFDFVTSIAELNAKLAYGPDHILLSIETCRQDWLRCIVKYSVEILTLAPLGVLICLMPQIPNKLAINILIGFFLGVLLEGVQLLLISGVAQGFSVITRVLGMMSGYFLHQWVIKQDYYWPRVLRLVALWAVLPYLVLVIAINGWFSSSWLSWSLAMEKLHATHFLPFYYFYYTSESLALVSLLSNFATYLPIGLIGRALTQSKKTRVYGIYTGVISALFASVVEMGKLFLMDKHADPTDILIAFIAACSVYYAINKVIAVAAQGKTASVVTTLAKDKLKLKSEQPAAQVGAVNLPLAKSQPDMVWTTKKITLCLILLLFIGDMLFKYPSGALALSLFLGAYAYLLIIRPLSWLLIIPALLPVMDFAPWTGWFFLDEYDLLVLTTVLVLGGCHQQRFDLAISKTSKWFLIFASIFYVVSFFRGLLPFQTIDLNTFSNYYSNYNSLRIAKGAIWALLLSPFLRHAIKNHFLAKYYWGFGVVLGLALMLSVSIIERLLFTGLFDFTTHYRISALFSSMHTGGGHIECYLALVMPFLTLLFVNPTHLAFARVFGLALFCMGVYVLLVTYSRGGYLAFLASFIVLVIGLAHAHKQIQATWKTVMMGLVLFVLAGLIFWPVLQGDLVKQRFSVVSQDKDIRKNHWKDALDMMDKDMITHAFGMGLGSYPRTYYLLNDENIVPATYKIETENDNPYLRLRGGDALYMGQFIGIKPQTDYKLVADVRSQNHPADLIVPICEKSLLYSIKCVTPTLKVKKIGVWEHYEVIINSGLLAAPLNGASRYKVHRPVQLALYNSNGPNEIIDVDNIALIEPTGRDLLSNGDFKNGLDNWLFTTDNHLPWHIKNIAIEVIFEQGWLGVLTLVSLLLIAFYKLAHRLRQDFFAAILLSSLVGFCVVGVVDSPFDAPRLTLLFLLLLMLAFFDDKKPVHTVF